MYIFRKVSDEEFVLNEVKRIGGHLSDSEIIALYRICNNLPDYSRIMEIGSYRGKSTNAFGHAIKGSNKGLYCLDIWRDYCTPENSTLLADTRNHEIEFNDFAVLIDFLKNTDWFKENLKILKGSTSDFSELLPLGFFDLIFIDGAHDYENVSNDIKISLRCLKPGGILCGHDYHSGGEEVIRAVTDLVVKDPTILKFRVIPETSIWFAQFIKY